MNGGVRFEVDGPIARITIDRPDVLNAIDAVAQDALEETWVELEQRNDVRVVILTGAGERAFSVGADMGGGPSGTGGVAYWAESRPNGFGGIALRRTLDIPVIARVNGYALGGGLEMLLGCDLVIAAEHAEVGLPEPRVGRVALDGGLALLPRRVPRVFALEMLLTGRRIKASFAHQMGLINEVVPYDDLDRCVDRMTDDILACAPLAVKAAKQLTQRSAHLSAEDAHAMRVPALVAALQSEDAQEGVAAFRDKRSPEWSGR